MRADRIVGQAELAGQFVHRAGFAPQQEHDLAARACEKPFVCTADGHGTSVHVTGH
jgi:hypothetical protein